MKLVIVESPSKCKKIESLLGKKEFRCVASVGHICEIANGLKGIDKDTFLPAYAIKKGKGGVVKKLVKECKEAETVYLATDPDREGEAIAYHLCLFLKLSVVKTPRVRFHELTGEAVRKAFAEPSLVDMNLVRAQQARQVLDLYVGYKLSPFLWKAVGPRLSAGRCQTPALRMLFDREQRVKDPQHLPSTLVMTADFNPGLQKSVLLHAPKEWERFEEIIKSMKKHPLFVIADTKSTNRLQNPPPPFITSSVQQDCHSTFHYSPQHTMAILQSLYEKGKITYMRTDSPALSENCIEECQVQIHKKYGPDYFEKRVYASTSSTSQEAHEAIRPTHMALEMVGQSFSEHEQKVYRRVWQRTMASQMVAYRFTETVVLIQCENTSTTFQNTRHVPRHQGWKSVYFITTTSQDSEEVPKPPPPLQSRVEWQQGEVVQEFQKGKGRHSEATLIKELEKHGIGRPSTFASLCSKIVERKYASLSNVKGITVPVFRAFVDREFKINITKDKVTLGNDHGKFVVTPTGQQVLLCLSQKFPWVLDYSFTQKMESDLETIVVDKKKYNTVLGSYVSKIEDSLQNSQTL
jgi:DNA topoisomerase-1